MALFTDDTISLSTCENLMSSWKYDSSVIGLNTTQLQKRLINIVLIVLNSAFGVLSGSMNFMPWEL